MAKKPADTVNLILRLPKALHKRLKQEARRHNVSLNTEIVNQLEDDEAVNVERMAEKMKPLIQEFMSRLGVSGDPWIEQFLADSVRLPTEAELRQRLIDHENSPLLRRPTEEERAARAEERRLRDETFRQERIKWFKKELKEGRITEAELFRESAEKNEPEQK
jgi:HicB family